MRLGGRKKCWIGAAIMGATSIAGSLFGAAAQKEKCVVKRIFKIGRIQLKKLLI